MGLNRELLAQCNGFVRHLHVISTLVSDRDQNDIPLRVVRSSRCSHGLEAIRDRLDGVKDHFNP